ncbi:MAG TPA: hypothetical protein VLH40_08495, partial [Atribacteraceae bacterium]|nr:hypothetical protein [Atribacteraceae bacterium]
AAGLKVEEKNISQLRETLNRHYGHEIKSLRGMQGLVVDAQISLSDINSRMLSWLEKLEPFGEKNPSPLFAALNVSLVKSWTWGKRNQHLKLLTRQDCDFQEAVVISGVVTAEELTQSSLVDLAFEIYRNNYGNYPYLKIHDWRIKK